MSMSLCKIGEGSYGKVYKYSNEDAVKVCKFDYCKEYGVSINIASWMELYVLDKCKNNPYIINIKNSFIRDDFFNCITVEYAHFGNVTLKSLSSIFKKKKCIYSAASAVSFLHSLNIMYRDVTLLNILDFGNDIYKLCDMGMCGYDQNPNVCSLWWRAPELLDIIPVYNHKIDCWSIGVLMHDIWTERFTFECDNEYELKKKISLFKNKIVDEPVSSFINSLIKINPNDRYELCEILKNKWWEISHFECKNDKINSNKINNKKISQIYAILLQYSFFKPDTIIKNDVFIFLINKFYHHIDNNDDIVALYVIWCKIYCGKVILKNKIKNVEYIMMKEKKIYNAYLLT